MFTSREINFRFLGWKFLVQIFEIYYITSTKYQISPEELIYIKLKLLLGMFDTHIIYVVIFATEVIRNKNKLLSSCRIFCSISCRIRISKKEWKSSLQEDLIENTFFTKKNLFREIHNLLSWKEKLYMLL